MSGLQTIIGMFYSSNFSFAFFYWDFLKTASGLKIIVCLTERECEREMLLPNVSTDREICRKPNCETRDTRCLEFPSKLNILLPTDKNCLSLNNSTCK